MELELNQLSATPIKSLFASVLLFVFKNARYGKVGHLLCRLRSSFGIRSMGSMSHNGLPSKVGGFFGSAG